MIHDFQCRLLASLYRRHQFGSIERETPDTSDIVHHTSNESAGLVVPENVNFTLSLSMEPTKS